IVPNVHRYRLHCPVRGVGEKPPPLGGGFSSSLGLLFTDFEVVITLRHVLVFDVLHHGLVDNMILEVVGAMRGLAVVLHKSGGYYPHAAMVAFRASDQAWWADSNVEDLSSRIITP
nr:hypothetical protein [Tanacetum cinerariifolium]